MSEKPGANIGIMRGDITALDVAAIVNAANTTLLGGGGVDGAIHRAAGPDLLAECRTLGGCKPGQAKLTRGYRLAARFVIHTVGPVWTGGERGEAQTLANCYRNSLQLAVKNGIKTIAFPAISCGAYGYPIREATQIAVETTRDYLATEDRIDKVIFVVANDEILRAYRLLL
ncbi:MAG: O-acetyl-ADP-ribose deacetylase [Verrucomicrobia bacterium]|nr:MAG: O-acetyl-ADP-ribose deacetylase [Verrucomicrobiota bacterium]